MAISPLWAILWVLAAAIAGARDVRRLDRAAPVGIEFVALGGASAIRRGSGMAHARAADRWAFRGGLVAMCCCWRGLAHSIAGDARTARHAGKRARLPTAPDASPPAIPQRPARHIDAELKNAILVHVPKTKQVRLVVLKDDAEADQFAWEIDAFLRAEGYKVVPRLFFAMAAGGPDAKRNEHVSGRKGCEHHRHQDRAERPKLKTRPTQTPAPETGPGFVAIQPGRVDHEPLPAGISSYLPSLPHL